VVCIAGGSQPFDFINLLIINLLIINLLIINLLILILFYILGMAQGNGIINIYDLR
jgi:hypothetical protein